MLARNEKDRESETEFGVRAPVPLPLLLIVLIFLLSPFLFDLSEGLRHLLAGE